MTHQRDVGARHVERSGATVTGSSVPATELSPLAAAMKTVGRILSEQAAMTTACELTALLLHMQDLVALTLTIKFYAELGAEAEPQRKELAALVPQMRALFAGRRFIGDWQAALDKIVLLKAEAYASAVDDRERRAVLDWVWTSLLMAFGQPSRAPGTVTLPHPGVPISAWPELLDLALRTVTKRGRPRHAIRLPAKRKITRAILAAWELGSNSPEAQAHAAKPSSRRARKRRPSDHQNGR